MVFLTNRHLTYLDKFP
jgi:hypothetical protein